MNFSFVSQRSNAQNRSTDQRLILPPIQQSGNSPGSQGKTFAEQRPTMKLFFF